jgi:outer membrane immunogenic protein
VDFLTPAGTVAGGCADRSGGLVGGQIGYRWQTNQSVLGLEAQGDWAEIKNTRVSLIDPLISTTGKIDGIGLFTAQFGWAWKASLFYVKGGAAVTRNRFDVFNNLTGVGLTPQVTRAGAVPSVSAGNTVSRRIGRSASNTTISGWGVTTRPSRAWSRQGASPFSATGSVRMWTWSHFG